MRTIIISFREEWTAQIREYVRKQDSTYRDTFQFAWSTDLDLLSHIGKGLYILLVEHVPHSLV